MKSGITILEIKKMKKGVATNPRLEARASDCNRRWKSAFVYTKAQLAYSTRREKGYNRFG